MNFRQNSNDMENPDKSMHRLDVLVEKDPRIVSAIKKAVNRINVVKRPLDASRPDNRLLIRKTLIESDKSDPNGYERIIGKSDFLSVNFLSRGLKAAAAVCRIRVPAQGGEWYGSGFLVGPRLLMTNNHVLSLPEEAAQTEAEFNYEHGADGVLNPPIQFNLAPHEVFFTDVVHDVTFVAVVPMSENGIPLERFGYLPLLPISGKGLEGEWVTIIQHPGGQPKQMTIRANQIIELDKDKFPEVPDRFIHYTTDTEPGSSGSPVLNDQWQVVAIHHKAIPSPLSGPHDKSGLGGDLWIANEGVRISSIFEMLERERFSNIHASTVLERLSSSIGLRPLQVWEPQESEPLDTEKQGKPLPAGSWKSSKLGYDPNFLRVQLPLDNMLGKRRKDAATLKGSSNVVLDYLHFSTVIDSRRKFPMLTAVNIHGSKLKHPGGRSNVWRRDIRMDDECQPGDNFYLKSEGDDKLTFSRGHLVRRLDPCWGTLQEARTAETHTFHFSNAAPQVQKYNDVEWGNLEDYILDRTQTLEKKVTVLTGPIFRESDPTYGNNRTGGPWQIPITFWKIAVIEKENGKISAAAFMIGQTEYIQALYESRVFSKLSPYTYAQLQSRKIQTTIATIEKETGFNFSLLRKFDVQSALESTRQTRFITQNSEIMI